MPDFRRIFLPGGSYFLTLVTQHRQPIFAIERWRTCLGEAIRTAGMRHPFHIDAVVLLPDHLHLIMRLPSSTDDFSLRVASIKSTFTRTFLAHGGHEAATSAAQQRKRRRGVWQRWFWEHLIRDERDFEMHLNYIHYNPVKHGLTMCPHQWEPSSFQRHVIARNYEPAWCCCCDGQTIEPPDFSGIAGEVEGFE